MEKTEYITASTLAKESGLSRESIYAYIKAGLIVPDIKADKVQIFKRSIIDRVLKIKSLTDSYKFTEILEKGLLDKE